jgi:hypothetical protein
MTLNTYGHVIAELRAAPWTSATEAIMRFRGSAPKTPPKRRNATLRDQRIAPSQPSRRPDSNRRPLHYEALGLLHSDLALRCASRPFIPYPIAALFRIYSAWAKELTHPRDGVARGGSIDSLRRYDAAVEVTAARLVPTRVRVARREHDRRHLRDVPRTARSPRPSSARHVHAPPVRRRSRGLAARPREARRPVGGLGL